MLTVFHLKHFFEIWTWWIWQNWNCAVFSLCSKESKPILNSNLDFPIWCSRLWLSQRKRPWKLYFWIDADFPVTWKFIGAILSILCDHSRSKILLLPRPKTNGQNHDKRYAYKPHFGRTVWAEVDEYVFGGCDEQLVFGLVEPQSIWHLLTPRPRQKRHA